MSIFGTNKSINADIKNILKSFFKITEFVKQRNYDDKIEKDIPHITEFSYAVWNHILSIYEYR